MPIEPDNAPVEDADPETGSVLSVDESTSDEGFPAQLLIGGLVASVLLALFPLLKYRKKV